MELFQTDVWRVAIDEDEPEQGHFWKGSCAGDKEGSTFDPGEPLIMNANHFPVGTVVEVSEPEDEEFYDKLFYENHPELKDKE